jgi:hypothetical protein
MAENTKRCVPPLPRNEIEGIKASAARWQQPWVCDLNTFVTDARLSSKARQLLCALAGHANHEGRCYPGYRRLSEITGIGINSIRDYLAELEHNDRIRIHREGKRRQSYELLRCSPGGDRTTT